MQQQKDIAAIELQVSHPLDKQPEISYANPTCTTCVYSCSAPLFSGAFTSLKKSKANLLIITFLFDQAEFYIMCLPLAIQSIPLVVLIVVCKY